MRNRAALTLSSFLLVVGCSQSNRDVTRPSDYQRLRGDIDKTHGHAVTYDGRGRGAYMKVEKVNGETVDRLISLCSEPPPDVTANLEAESSFKLDLEALAEYEAFKANLGLATQAKANASSTIADAATRTELVLFMRDALYRVCEMHFNKVLTNAEAKEVFMSVISAGRALGQRDNIAKLVGLAETLVSVCKDESCHMDPALVHDVVGTIRFLAAADYLFAANTQSDALVAQVLMETLLGTDYIVAARKAMEARLEQTKREYEAVQEEKKKIEAKAKKNKADRASLEELERKQKALLEQQESEESLYRDLMHAEPPADKLISGPTGGASID